MLPLFCSADVQRARELARAATLHLAFFLAAPLVAIFVLLIQYKNTHARTQASKKKKKKELVQ